MLDSNQIHNHFHSYDNVISQFVFYNHTRNISSKADHFAINLALSLVSYEMNNLKRKSPDNGKHATFWFGGKNDKQMELYQLNKEKKNIKKH